MSYGRFRRGCDVFWMMRVEPAPAMRFMETRHERPCWVSCITDGLSRNPTSETF